MSKHFKYIFAVFIFFSTVSSFAQQAFEDGEWLKFRIHYGPFNASYATLQVKETKYKDKPVYHIVGKGKSTGMLHLFFKVDDNYETYIDKNTGYPYRFIRNIDEGGHTKDVIIDFNHQKNEAFVHDRKRDTKKTFTTAEDVHDMLSAFYYLRNNLDVSNLEPGNSIILNMFFDNENYPFKLKFLGREVVKSKIGKIECLKFRPYVMTGRVFKEEESLTFWVSDDKNRIPIKIEADIAVGSLEADIDGFKGLKHPLKVIIN